MRLAKLARLAALSAVTLTIIFTRNADSQLTASIRGTVTDRTGATLPGVTVSVAQNCKCRRCSSKCDCCPAARTGVTDSHGFFSFGGLESGEYSVRAELTGFKDVNVDSVRLAGGESAHVDLTLELANVSESP
jgi:uncharacterized protein (DUF2141 family)